MDGDAQDYAAELARWCRRALEESGHTNCEYLDRAQYLPDQAVAVCGCGQFTDAPVVSEPRGDEPDEVIGAHAAGTAVAARGGTIAYQARDPIESMLALIDPTEIFTPDQINRHILDVLARLETGAKFERETILRVYAATEAWERHYNRALLASTKSAADQRKAEAMVSCDDSGLTQEKYEAKMLAEAAKSTMHNLRGVLTGYQSTAKSVAATYGGAGYEPPY
jgi:hypothetical protein